MDIQAGSYFHPKAGSWDRRAGSHISPVYFACLERLEWPVQSHAAGFRAEQKQPQASRLFIQCSSPLPIWLWPLSDRTEKMFLGSDMCKHSSITLAMAACQDRIEARFSGSFSPVTLMETIPWYRTERAREKMCCPTTNKAWDDSFSWSCWFTTGCWSLIHGCQQLCRNSNLNAYPEHIIP